jgi:type IV pilus assembly protein PilA
MITRRNKPVRGFTLIEILIVIGIIAILAAIVIIAINPAKQFAQARNAQRESNVAALLSAIGQNIADNKGTFTCTGVTVPGALDNIGTGAGQVDLESCLIPTYIPLMVMDPESGTNADTLYTVKKDGTTGRFQVCAPLHAETEIPGALTYCLER